MSNIIFNGSHVVADDKDLKMFHINYSFKTTGTVVVFAADIEDVRTLINQEKNRIDIPLPFKGHDGSQNIEDIIVKVADPTASYCAD